MLQRKSSKWVQTFIVFSDHIEKTTFNLFNKTFSQLNRIHLLKRFNHHSKQSFKKWEKTSERLDALYTQIEKVFYSLGEKLSLSYK